MPKHIIVCAFCLILLVAMSGCANASIDNISEQVTVLPETGEPVAEHFHHYAINIENSTCTTHGEITYVCDCGNSYVEKELELLSHTYTTNTVLMTCDADGYTIYTCNICGDEFIADIINTTGHTYNKTTIAPTYTNGGYDINTCLVCNDEFIDNYIDVISHEHSYKETIHLPTCTENGYTTYSCMLCGYSYTDNPIDALGHVFVLKTVEPTGKEQGYDLHTCSICGSYYKDNYTDVVVNYTEVNETVYANTTVNIRKGPSINFELVGTLTIGQSITRIATGDNGWSKVLYNDEICYMYSEYIQTTKPTVAQSGSYPMTYSDATCTITISKEWFENAWCYIAHIQFADYTRFGTSCANGSYNNGYETTSHAAYRLGAIFAVNGCYSAPSLGYGVARSGVLWNDLRCIAPAVYSSNTGIFASPYDIGVSKEMLSTVVADGRVTDTFWFGPAILSGGEVTVSNSSERAQRTFIGTNGNAGDIWIIVSDGRYNDGESAGLTHHQCARLLQSKGCIFGVPLDGGGSSTMFFNGRVLNAANGNQRAVVDFVYFK